MGRWMADVRYDFGGTHSETFVSGSPRHPRGHSVVLGVRAESSTASSGAAVSFKTRLMKAPAVRPPDGTPVRGIVNGDELRLSMETMGGFSPHAPIDFVARRIDLRTHPTNRSPPIRGA
jgi:hypothetical protein